MKSIGGQGLLQHDRAVTDLKVNRRNARSHSDRQTQQIAANLCEFGWLAPIVIDEEDTLLAGHGRLRAALFLDMETVPAIQVKHLTPERKRAFMLADNRLAQLAEWDEELLAIELKELSGIEIDFDFEITGFETKDLDRLEGPVAKPAKVEVVPFFRMLPRSPFTRPLLGKPVKRLLVCNYAWDRKGCGLEKSRRLWSRPRIHPRTSLAHPICLFCSGRLDGKF